MALVAVIVKDVEEKSAVGVPETTPVFALMVNPEGKSGEMLQEVALPPVFVGTRLRIDADVAN